MFFDTLMLFFVIVTFLLFIFYLFYFYSFLMFMLMDNLIRSGFSKVERNLKSKDKGWLLAIALLT